MSNEEKINYVETIIQKVLDSDDFQMSDDEGERFIKEYLDLSRTIELDPITRMRFVIICVNQI